MSSRLRSHSSLTPRQNEIYEFVRSCIEKERRPPTIPEIAARFELRSTNGVFLHLKALEEKGYITRDRNKARGITLVDTSGSSGAGTPGARRIPIVGDGHSSNPFSIFMNPRGMFTPDPGIMPVQNAFVAIVSDDAMDGDGIFKGDYAVVRQATEFRDGALVFALVEERHLVRRLSEAGPRRFLTAVNRHYERIHVREGDPGVALLGEVVTVVRTVGG